MPEIPEGILRNVNVSTDNVGNTIITPSNDTRLLLSKSQIETVDLISEGKMQGFISGNYTYSGVIGEVGWRNVSFSGFKVPNSYSSDLSYLRSIYLNQIPILDDLGKFNFQSINLSYTNGTPNGEALRTLSPYQSVSRTVGERLRGGDNNSKYYRIFNKDCKAVVVTIKISSLSSFNQITGETERASVSYSIYYRPVFSNRPSTEFILGGTENILGKISTSDGYVRPTRVNFNTTFSNDKFFVCWEIKVSRYTPDSTSQYLGNITIVDNITEIQENIFVYPNSAVVRQLFDAEYFSNIPERFFHVQGVKVKIPGNYNPLLRTYSGAGFATTNGGWNGEWATGVHYTNNPAWCYYDLLTNTRYGLGKHIDPDYTDKWELYNIAKYCDTLVSNGEGGLEPRFTCNLWLTQKEEAYKVINDMASIFRGISYYANGYIYTAQDSPKNAKIEFTNANVENGEFVYSSTSKRARSSVVIVRYNDPRNFYAPAIEYVEDFNAIRKYGIRESEITAFGCTSRGQAIRLGRWKLLSEDLESETVNFTAGLGAAVLRPGDVFKVSDINKKSKRHGGRALSIDNIGSTGARVVLDGKIDVEPNVKYSISFLTPTYNYNGYSVTGLTSINTANNRSFLQNFSFSGFQYSNSGSRGILNLYSGFNTSDYIISGNPVWVVELSEQYAGYTGARYFTNSNTDYYRAINISEKEGYKYDIEAIQYNPQKYIEIESGLLYDRKQLQLNNIPSSPRDLVSNVYGESNSLKNITYSFTSDDISNTNTFKVYIKSGAFPDLNVPSNSYLARVLPNNITYGTYTTRNEGEYHIRVYASNDVEGILSPNFASGAETIYPLSPITDYIVSSLNIQSTNTGLYSGNRQNGNINVLVNNDSDPVFQWQIGNSYGYNSDSNLLKHRITVREYNYSSTRVPSDTIYYEATGINGFNWTFDFDTNVSIGPVRQYQVVVELHNENGDTSAGNRVGQSDNISGISWLNNPQGYDIISVNNVRPNNFQLNNMIPTQLSGDGEYITGLLSGYSNTAYIGPNGDIIIQFTSGTFESDIVGGYIYTSTGRFPLLEASVNTGEWGAAVSKNNFAFDPNNPYIYHPTAASNLKNGTKGYVSVSLYDSIDRELIYRGNNISTGLFITHNALVYNDAQIGRLTLGGGQYGGQTLQVIRYSGAPASAGYDTVNWDNLSVIASGTVSGVTSILYMAPQNNNNIQW